MRLLSLIFLILISMSCETTLILDENTTQKIIYNFHDSSVPPEYHRSYKIELNSVSASIIVDSYGDILHNENYTLEKGSFSGLIQLINNSKLSECKSNADEMCSGGTSESLEIFEETSIFNIHLSHCGGNEIPPACGEIRQVIDKIESFIPNLSDLLQ